jgi:hypothetical protein
MKDDIFLEVLLKKYESLRFKHENIIKQRQSYLYVTLFTSATYLFLIQFSFRYVDSLSLFPILLLPTIFILMLWLQNFLFYLPYGSTRNIEYRFYEENIFGKIKTNKELREVFDADFKYLYRSIIINGRRNKMYQMYLTITWFILIIVAIFPFFLRLFYF